MAEQGSTGMSVIEVLANDPSAAQNELLGLEEVRSVTQLGIRLRVLIPEHVADPVSLVETALAGKGLRSECTLVGASLEDVFVALTGRHLRDG